MFIILHYIRSWFMDISLGKNIRHVLNDLRPYTVYAFYVQTLTVTDYHNPVKATSLLQYFRTAPSQPGPPSLLFYQPVTLSQMVNVSSYTRA